AGQVVEQVDPLGRTTSFGYDANQTYISEPNRSLTIVTYSGGELLTRTVAAGTPEAAVWISTYDPRTLSLASTTDPDGNTTRYTYDAAGNLTSTTDPLGRVTSTTYNEFNEPLTKTSPMGVTTTYTYDARGNLLSTSTPLTNSSTARVSQL